MPRLPKFEETPFEKTNYSGKVFMYNSPEWAVLFPIVEIIRSFRPYTIIGYTYGKGQMNIKTYSSQYYHRILGYDLKSKKNYLDALKTVKCLFIFNDSQDNVAQNLLLAAKGFGIMTVCYSNIDNLYTSFNLKENFSCSSPEEVTKNMYHELDLIKTKEIAELFPDFEIIEKEETVKESCLDECIKKLNNVTLAEKKRAEKDLIKFYDPNLSRIKQMEKDRVRTVYDDEIKRMGSVNIFKKFTKKG